MGRSDQAPGKPGRVAVSSEGSMTPSDRFCEALVFAVRLHADQRRKASDVPYAAHLLKVTALALEHGADEDEAIAALLHDAVEDQGGVASREEIRRRFGDRVTEIVVGCSDTDRTPKPPWRDRKEAYLAHLPHASSSVRLVCACDKLDNVRALIAGYRLLGESLWQRFRGGREGTLWYHRRVAEILKAAGTTPLVEELERAVGALEELVGQGPQESI